MKLWRRVIWEVISACPDEQYILDVTDGRHGPLSSLPAVGLPCSAAVSLHSARRPDHEAEALPDTAHVCDGVPDLLQTGNLAGTVSATKWSWTSAGSLHYHCSSSGSTQLPKASGPRWSRLLFYRVELSLATAGAKSLQTGSPVTSQVLIESAIVQL